jgi:chaperonin GroES
MFKDPMIGDYWIEPLYDKLIVKPEETKAVTKGGIVIPDDAVERTQRGHVVAVGPGRITAEGNLIPMAVDVGDYVLYAKYGGTEVKFEDGETYLILSERDVHAILSKDD